MKIKNTVKLFPLFLGTIFLLCPALFLSGCDNPAAFSSASVRDSEFTKIFEENAKALENDLDSLVQEAEASPLHKHSDHIKLTAADPGYDIFIPSTGPFHGIKATGNILR